MAVVYRLIAVLDLGNKDYPYLLTRGHAIYNGLAGHPSMFQSPSPALPILLARIDALDKAQQVAGTRVKGSASVRNLRAGELVTCLGTAHAYVQDLADQSPEQAASLIEAAGMKIGGAPQHDKPVLQARQRTPGGAVQLIANVSILRAETKGRIFFNWQYSADGGSTWLSALSTPHGTTEIGGLQPLTTYQFRASVTDKSGAWPWSPIVSLMVL